MGIDYGSMREALRKRREEGLASIAPSERLQFLKDYADTLEVQIVRMTAQLEAHTLYDVGKIVVASKDKEAKDGALTLSSALGDSIISKETIAKIAEDNRKPDIIRVEGENDLSLYCYVTHGVFRLTITNIAKEVAWLSDVAVDEAWRNLGVGNKMLSVAEGIAERNKCTAISLQVKADSWMKDWYARKGYSVVGEGYMDNMVMMSKKLK